MSDSILRSKHTFGNSENIAQALSSKKIDEYDIMFLDGDTDNPKIGWIDKNGKPIIVQQKEDVVNVNSLPESGEIGKVYILGEDAFVWTGEKFSNLCKPTDVSALEEEISKKADAEMVESQIDAVVDSLESYVARNANKNPWLYEIMKFSDAAYASLH